MLQLRGKLTRTRRILPVLPILTTECRMATNTSGSGEILWMFPVFWFDSLLFFRCRLREAMQRCSMLLGLVEKEIEGKVSLSSCFLRVSPLHSLNYLHRNVGLMRDQNIMKH